jgi:hypothetical protein
MNVLLIPRSCSDSSFSESTLTLSDSIYMLIGLAIVIWICRTIVKKYF